jgi:hypothetical protein
MTQWPESGWSLAYSERGGWVEQKLNSYPNNRTSQYLLPLIPSLCNLYRPKPLSLSLSLSLSFRTFFLLNILYEGSYNVRTLRTSYTTPRSLVFSEHFIRGVVWCTKGSYIIRPLGRGPRMGSNLILPVHHMIKPLEHICDTLLYIRQNTTVSISSCYSI